MITHTDISYVPFFSSFKSFRLSPQFYIEIHRNIVFRFFSISRMSVSSKFLRIIFLLNAGLEKLLAILGAEIWKPSLFKKIYAIFSVKLVYSKIAIEIIESFGCLFRGVMQALRRCFRKAATELLEVSSKCIGDHDADFWRFGFLGNSW